MINTHTLASSMAGIGIYEFLLLSLTLSKMCYEALNSYSKDNTETALFYSFLFTTKKKMLNHQNGKKTPSRWNKIRWQFQCYFS